MKPFRKIYIIWIFCLLIAAAGCSKILKEEPRVQVTPQIINTQAGIEAVLAGVYSNLRNFWGTEGFAHQVSAGTDELIKGRDGLDQYHNYINLLPNDFNNIWGGCYQSINNLNGIIDIAPGTSMDATLKTTRISEAKFLRGLYYYLLVLQFGDVPLNLSFITAPSTAASRQPQAEVYAAIIKDLNEAFDGLPTKPDQSPGRAAKAAALHLLAKVYLTKGWSPAAEADDFKNAYTTAEKLINTRSTYGLDLWQDFSDVFKEGNEYGKEAIFLVDRNTNALFSESGYNNTTATNKENRSNHYWRPLYTDPVPGSADTAVLATMQTATNGGATFANNSMMTRDVTNGRPFIRFRPTAYTLDIAFAERVNDARYDKTFKKEWIFNRADVTSIATRRGTLVKNVDTAIYMPGREVTLAERNAFKGVIIAPSQYNSVWFPFMRKHDDQTRLHFNDPSDRPLNIFRLAETYLIAAEARLKDGDQATAAQHLNVLRQRAAYRTTNSAAQNTAAAAAMTITSDVVTVDFILDEITRERYGEYNRWLDLARTKKLIERVKKYNPSGGPNIQPYHILRPIPQDQIDRTTTGPRFPQNEGY